MPSRRSGRRLLNEELADAEDPEEYLAENVFWVPKAARWSHLQAKAKQNDNRQGHRRRDAGDRRPTNASLKGVLPKDYARPALDFPFKNKLFAMLLAAMMIPGIVNIVPIFIMYKHFGWLDNHISLIAAPAIANTFGTFLYRQFMLTIPQELVDAAKIDGASAWGIYWRIMMPLTKPVAAVLATFTFIGTWNQFFEPLVFLKSTEQFTVTIGLATFRQEEGTIWNLLMAASVITLLPSLIIFMFTQRYFVRGIVTTGLK